MNMRSKSLATAVAASRKHRHRHYYHPGYGPPRYYGGYGYAPQPYGYYGPRYRRW